MTPADQCATCTRPMRPQHELAIDHPNTVRRSSTTECQSCCHRRVQAEARTAIAHPPVPLVQVDAGERWNLLRPDACGDDSFFPAPPKTRRHVVNYDTPRAVCAVCPVREFGCAPFILKAEAGLPGFQRQGFAAGMTPRERAQTDPVARADAVRRRGASPAKIDRPLGPINHGTPGGYGQHLKRKIPACEGCLRAHRLNVNLIRMRTAERRAQERASAA